MASRGGFREGSGRPPGSVNKATTELKSNLSALAREYTQEALETLVDVMESGQSDSARVTAAGAILDRGYGRPTQQPIKANIDIVAPTKIELVPFSAQAN